MKKTREQFLWTTGGPDRTRPRSPHLLKIWSIPSTFTEQPPWHSSTPSVPRHTLTGHLEPGRATGRHDIGVLNIAEVTSHTSWCSGEKCCGYWNTAGTTLPRNRSVRRRQGHDSVCRHLLRLTTTLVCISLRLSSSHFMKQRKDVSWIPLASLPLGLAWDNTGSVQRQG